MFSHFLRFLLVASLVAQSFPVALFAAGTIGEDLGTDIYKQIDSSYGSTRKTLASKRLVGGIARMNKAIQSECSVWANARFLKAGQEFSIDELSQIESWVITPLLARIDTSGQGGNSLNFDLNGDLFQCVNRVVRKDYARVKLEASREQKTLTKLGGIGLYTDGNAENSSFDLMKDLQDIQDIIFTKDLPYNGSLNTSAQNVAGFLANPESISSGLTDWLTLTDRLSFDLTDSGWRFPRTSTGATTTGTGSTGTGGYLGPLCAAPSTISGLDAGLLNDLTRQTIFGRNTGTQTTPFTNTPPESGSGTLSGSTLSGATAVKKERSSPGAGRFKCDSFFCIEVEFIMYDGFLLGGGKNYSIESILMQNLKIVNRFAGSSFIQAKHTNNFFELLLKDINLPGMAHIGTVVTSLPPPILNLPKNKGPKWASKQSDEQKEYAQMRTEIFKNYGIDAKRENSLAEIASNERDYGITLLQELTTDSTRDKLTPGRVFSSEYVAAKEYALKNEYYDSFMGEILQFEAFTKAFVDHLWNFGTLIKKINDIPQG